MSRRTAVWIGATVLLLAVVYAATSVEAYHTVAYVCNNTGSRFGYRLWPGGVKTGSWSSKSPLEDYLGAAKLDRPIQHRWFRSADMGTTILGKNISFRDGPVGGMVLLSKKDLQIWMQHHSRSDIVGLYDFLCAARPKESWKRAEQIQEEVRRYD